ncbi:MAG TPA: T9SS type A sorting domain-containing protein, partial [Adhaeribacter sp.]|nr:T9SS type A sorting domain-containing protein [Adhaeribacter sp.]
SLTTVPKNGTVYTFTPAPVLPAFAEEIRLTVYPNPVTEVLQIEGFAESGETVLVKIYDAMGRVVLRREEPAAAAIPVNLQALRKGAYYVELNCGSRRAGKRIIKM